MTTRYRKNAGTIANLPLPRVPQDFARDGRAWAMDLLRALDRQNDVLLLVQDAGTDKQLRAKLNFIGATVTDDPTNDAIDVTVTNATTGFSGTLTVRDAAGTGTCTLTVVNGRITASTC